MREEKRGEEEKKKSRGEKEERKRREILLHKYMIAPGLFPAGICPANSRAFRDSERTFSPKGGGVRKRRRGNG